MTKLDFNLEDFLPYRLSVAANAVSKRIAKTYAPYKLSRTQWRVMAVLASCEELTAQSVADKTGMDKTTVSRAVAKMLDRGLLKRGTSQQDARSAPLPLNTKGKAMFAKIAPQALRQEQELKDMFTDTDLVQLTTFLDKLVDGN
ncbi:MAG: MarR family winged helix-turn-helix transcriptional regulator [Robiginitomaculum sp.]|nr:MarR family winged helix-turn-helix transcriptional regulator [Robiginitomaculum sp.]